VTWRIRSERQDTIPDSTTVALSAARRLASTILSGWEKGESADATAAFERHPELRQFRSVAMDLVYEDYCRQREAGLAVDPDEFANRFPDWRNEIRRQIEVHGFLADHDDLATLPMPWPKAGDDFAGFTIVEELGRGAIARVYLATEPAIGNRSVVLKISSRGGGEAQLLGRLEHPNIVPVYSVVEEPTTSLTAICMPYRGRVTLLDLLDRLYTGGRKPRAANDVSRAFDEIARDHSEKNGRPPGVSMPSKWVGTGLYVDAVLRLAFQLADALAYTHARRILHRDIKPSNILLSTDGVPMLLDFNLSADLGHDVSRVGGTLPYMSPEQVRQVAKVAAFVGLSGDARFAEFPEVDERTDIYSMGVVLYELLTGTHPFADFAESAFTDSAATDLLVLQQRGVSPAHKLNPQVDKALSGMVASCMSFDVALRPTSVKDLAKEIASQLSARRRIARWMRWHPIRSSALGLILIGALASGAMAFALMPSPSEAAWANGMTALRSMDLSRAVAEFQTVADLQPESGLAWCAVGRCRFLQKDYSSARDCFNRAHQTLGDPRMLVASGYASAQLGEFPQAAQRYSEAETAGVGDVRLLFNLAAAHESSRSFDNAIDAISRAINRLSSETTEHAALKASAYWRRANLRLNRAALTSDAIPAGALKDAEQAINAAGDSHRHEYYLTAAFIAARGETEPGGNRQRIMAWVSRAHQLGAPEATIRADPAIRKLIDEVTLNQILQVPQTPAFGDPPKIVFDPFVEGFALPDVFAGS
jgi:serine/threonine protein kinase